VHARCVYASASEAIWPLGEPAFAAEARQSTFPSGTNSSPIEDARRRSPGVPLFHYDPARPGCVSPRGSRWESATFGRYSARQPLLFRGIFHVAGMNNFAVPPLVDLPLDVVFLVMTLLAAEIDQIDPLGPGGRRLILIPALGVDQPPHFSF